MSQKVCCRGAFLVCEPELQFKKEEIGPSSLQLSFFFNSGSFLQENSPCLVELGLSHYSFVIISSEHTESLWHPYLFAVLAPVISHCMCSDQQAAGLLQTPCRLSAAPLVAPVTYTGIANLPNPHICYSLLWNSMVYDEKDLGLDMYRKNEDSSPLNLFKSTCSVTEHVSFLQ